MALISSKTSICMRCLSRMKSLCQSKSSIRNPTRTCSSFISQQSRFQFEPVPDLEYLLNPTNLDTIRENIRNRKGVGDIDLLHKLFAEYKETSDDLVRERLSKEALLIPNQTSPDTMGGSEGKVVKTHITEASLATKGKSFEVLCHKQGLLRFRNIIMSTLVYGARSYTLMGDLARLERALIRWTIDRLRARGWQYVVVPDMLPESVVSACGFVTTGRQSQIYKVKDEQGGLCFAGTSEIPLAALHAGQRLTLDKPIKLCAYSPCYRAEEARNKVDKGFYRLHQFNKVEMFGICMPSRSDELLEEIVSIQCDLFSELGLSYRLLHMPSEELGAPAYKKYDVEAWINSIQHWGEISSASNCTDYQARRLAITMGVEQFAHTVNGTGCAVPRMLMALVEQHQTETGVIRVPECLQPYTKQTHLRPSSKFAGHGMKFVTKRHKHF